MENFSPSRIQPLPAEQEKNRDDPRQKKLPNPRVISRKAPQTPPLDMEKEEEHQLDEQA